MASSIIQNKGLHQSFVIILLYTICGFILIVHLKIYSSQTSWININQLQSDYVHLKIVPNCKFCGAKRFEYESPGFCCNNGSIKLVSNQVPTELHDLYFGNTEESEHFQTYNNMFAFTSLGVNYDKELAKRNHDIYTFRVQDVPDLSNFYIALKSDAGLDQRVYNLPTTSEVAAIWVEKEFNEIGSSPHIRIYTRSNQSQILNYYYGCYDPLQYPLLFPYGQSGWHCAIKKNNTSKRYI
ncbi:hypothetical protein H5410_058135 [Solanum commersonii]|uniref:Uncharacterized protein n=1 Tax=Solanum commersonii TaxID=4109 RepID=A0A9J5WQ63_SOLCO|nr:hypothetical protein H5410_058135 [Solanum commersonii]